VTPFFGIKGAFLRFSRKRQTDLRQFFSGFRRKNLFIQPALKSNAFGL